MHPANKVKTTVQAAVKRLCMSVVLYLPGARPFGYEVQLQLIDIRAIARIVAQLFCQQIKRAVVLRHLQKANVEQVGKVIVPLAHCKADRVEYLVPREHVNDLAGPHPGLMMRVKALTKKSIRLLCVCYLIEQVPRDNLAFITANRCASDVLIGEVSRYFSLYGEKR
jgi:hypothetical protein